MNLGEDDELDEEYEIAVRLGPYGVKDVSEYGGERPWFLCPARGCGRRVAILYGGRIFACRHCYRLVYECQREAPHYQALRRGQKLHEKLNGFGGVLEGLPPRPRGMHRRTYLRLAKRWLRATREMDFLAGRHFGMLV